MCQRWTMQCRPATLVKALRAPLHPPKRRGAASFDQKDPLGSGHGCCSCGRQPSLPRLQWSRPGSSGQGSLHMRPQGTQSHDLLVVAICKQETAHFAADTEGSPECNSVHTVTLCIQCHASMTYAHTDNCMHCSQVSQYV